MLGVWQTPSSDGGSYNGSTKDFESFNLGSNPSPPATILKERMMAEDKLLTYFTNKMKIYPKIQLM